MIKFQVTRDETSEIFIGEAEDMGLCYVTKFVVDGDTIYSFTPTKHIDRVSANERMKNDEATLEAKGLYNLEILD